MEEREKLRGIEESSSEERMMDGISGWCERAASTMWRSLWITVLRAING
jgi:hypothetical protein